MSRSRLYSTFVLALAGAGLVPVASTVAQAVAQSGARGQTAQASPAAPPVETRVGKVISVAEANRPAEKCVITEAWRMPDGNPAMQARSQISGEMMTIVERPDAPTPTERFRVFRWGASSIPPEGCPMPPTTVVYTAPKGGTKPEQTVATGKATAKTAPVNQPATQQAKATPATGKTNPPATAMAPATSKPAAPPVAPPVAAQKSVDTKPPATPPVVAKKAPTAVQGGLVQAQATGASQNAKNVVQATLPPAGVPAAPATAPKSPATQPVKNTSESGVFTMPGSVAQATPAAKPAMPTKVESKTATPPANAGGPSGSPTSNAAGAPAATAEKAVPSGRIVTVTEANGPPQQCTVVGEISLPDGGTGLSVKSLDTGEVMTIVERRNGGILSFLRWNGSGSRSSSAPPATASNERIVSERIISERVVTLPSQPTAPPPPPVASVPVKTEPAKTEQVKAEPIKAEPFKTQSVKAEPAKETKTIMIVPPPEPAPKVVQAAPVVKSTPPPAPPAQAPIMTSAPKATPPATTVSAVKQPQPQSPPAASVPPMRDPILHPEHFMNTNRIRVQEAPPVVTPATPLPGEVYVDTRRIDSPWIAEPTPRLPQTMPFIEVVPANPGPELPVPVPVPLVPMAAGEMKPNLPPPQPRINSFRTMDSTSVQERMPQAAMAPSCPACGQPLDYTRSAPLPVQTSANYYPPRVNEGAPAPGPISATLWSQGPAVPVTRTQSPVLAGARQLMGEKEAQTMEQIVEHMTLLHSSGDPAHREAAATQLRKVDAQTHPYVVETLMNAAKTDNAALVRAAAIQSLAHMRAKTQPVLATIEAATRDRDPRVRDEAAQALAMLGVKPSGVQPVGHLPK